VPHPNQSNHGWALLSTRAGIRTRALVGLPPRSQHCRSHRLRGRVLAQQMLSQDLPFNSRVTGAAALLLGTRPRRKQDAPSCLRLAAYW